MTKKKPNYTQFMRRPTPLEMSPPSHTDDPRPSPSVRRPREVASEQEIPWGEIIVEFGPHDAVPLNSPDQSPKPAPRPAAPAPASAPEPPRTSAPKEPLSRGQSDDAIIDGIPFFAEPAPAEAPALAAEMVELAFPGPGAPPLVFMAIAVVLLLCLL